MIAEETGLELYSLGSATFNREDLRRGFEPDSCFYVQNALRVQGKDRIDLTVDPAPDLILEIDITHSSLDKLSIVADIGVPEVWRYDGARLSIYVLAARHYGARLRSLAFPAVTAAVLTALLPASLGTGDIAWIRQAHAWARTLAESPGDGV